MLGMTSIFQSLGITTTPPFHWEIPILHHIPHPLFEFDAWLPLQFTSQAVSNSKHGKFQICHTLAVKKTEAFGLWEK